MNKVIFLHTLKAFTEDTVNDLLLPVSVQRESEIPGLRQAAVHLMRLPDGKSAAKKAPYILHQLITGADEQIAGSLATASCTVRTIFCVYCEDEEVGALHLLNLMERLRIALLKKRILGNQFTLDLAQKMETLVYTDDIAPYFAGEMVSHWHMPAVQQEVTYE